MSKQEQPAIQITELRKEYRGSKKSIVKAVDNLSLSIVPGQVFGFLGANGAGKTTTIKMICGLITPTAGRILVNGYDVARQRRLAAQQIGAVLEGTRNIYWRLSAWENLMYFGRLKGCTGSALKARAELLLKDLELWDRRHDSLRFFSRGMQQKVAIACALVADPPIVLLDEPTLGLDIQASITVKAWISRLAREEGKTVILTTHQLDIAQDLCERIAIMRKGRLLTNQSLEDLLYLFRQEHYQIKVKGRLDPQQQARFGEFAIEESDDNTTTITGNMADQEELYRYLALLRSLDLILLTVHQVEPDLEEIFMQLIDEAKKGDTHAGMLLSSLQ